MLNGRLRDPVVGGHLLVGIFFGVFSAFATEISAYINTRSTGIPSQAVLLGPVLGVARVASAMVGMLPNLL